MPSPYGVAKANADGRAQWAKNEAQVAGFSSSNAAWVSCCAVRGGFETLAVAPLFKVRRCKLDPELMKALGFNSERETR